MNIKKLNSATSALLLIIFLNSPAHAFTNNFCSNLANTEWHGQAISQDNLNSKIDVRLDITNIVPVGGHGIYIVEGNVIEYTAQHNYMDALNNVSECNALYQTITVFGQSYNEMYNLVLKSAGLLQGNVYLPMIQGDDKYYTATLEN